MSQPIEISIGDILLLQSIEIAVRIDIPVSQYIEIAFRANITVSQPIEIYLGEI